MTVVSGLMTALFLGLISRYPLNEHLFRRFICFLSGEVLVCMIVCAPHRCSVLESQKRAADSGVLGLNWLLAPLSARK